MEYKGLFKTMLILAGLLFILIILSGIVFSKVYISGVQDTINASTFHGNLSWSYLQNYPAECPTGSYLTQLNDSVTCTTPSEFLLLSGGNMTGDIGMGGYNLTNSPALQETADYVIWKDGSMIKAKNSTGHLEFSSTNASYVFQSANDKLTNGGLIHTKKGEYILNTTINIGSNIIFEGSGQGNTIFKLADGTVCNGLQVNGKQNITIRDIGINGNQDKQNCTISYSSLIGIRIYNSTQVLVTNCGLIDCCGSGILIAGKSNHISLIGNYLENNSDGQIFTRHSTNLIIQNNILHIHPNSDSYYAIASLCCKDVILKGNEITDIIYSGTGQVAGINVEGCYDVIVDGNIARNTSHGIEVRQAYECNINEITDEGSDTIQPKNIVISNNNVHNQTIGIFVAQGKNILLTGNFISDSYYGIDVYKAHSVHSTNNFVVDCKVGIMFESSSTNTSADSNLISNSTWNAFIIVANGSEILNNIIKKTISGAGIDIASNTHKVILKGNIIEDAHWSAIKTNANSNAKIYNNIVKGTQHFLSEDNNALASEVRWNDIYVTSTVFNNQHENTTISNNIIAGENYIKISDNWNISGNTLITGTLNTGKYLNVTSSDYGACSTSYEGFIVYNSTSKKFLGCNSSSWNELG